MKFTRESLQLISSSILYEGSTNQYRLCIQEKANRVLLLNNIAPALRSLALSLLLQKPLKNINKKNDAKGKGTNGNDHGNHTDGDDGNFNNEVLFSVVRQLVFAEGSKNIPLEKIDKFVFEISSGETEPVVIFSMLYEEILELHKTYHFGKYSLCKSRIRTYVQFVLTCQKLRQCFFLFMQSLSQLLFIWIACNEAMSKQHRTNFVFSSKKKRHDHAFDC